MIQRLKRYYRKDLFNYEFDIPGSFYLPQFCRTFNVLNLCVQFSLQKRRLYVRGGLTKDSFFILLTYAKYLSMDMKKGYIFEFKNKIYEVEEFTFSTPPCEPGYVITNWKEL
jgi:hypothetical protein